MEINKTFQNCIQITTKSVGLVDQLNKNATIQMYFAKTNIKLKKTLQPMATISTYHRQINKHISLVLHTM